jgi:hypothetical protein
MIGGGEFKTNNASLYECWELDYSMGNKGILNKRANLVYPRHGHSVCAISDSFMVVTGTRKDVNRSAHRVEMYDIEHNKWSELPMMREGRYYHASCSFNNEWIYVFCGISILKQHHHLFSIERISIKAVFDGVQTMWEPIITTP